MIEYNETKTINERFEDRFRVYVNGVEQKIKVYNRFWKGKIVIQYTQTNN